MTFAHPLARLLPGEFPERLAFAAWLHDHRSIDAITDQLARDYPQLVRRRDEVGLPFSLPQKPQPSIAAPHRDGDGGVASVGFRT